MIEIQNIYFKNVFSKIKFNRKIENFIYCSGKSGSMSLTNTLNNSYHTHSLLNFLRYNNLKISDIKKINIDFNMFKLLNENSKKYKTKKICVYDAYRTPIERKISAFFHFLNFHNSNSHIDNFLKKIKKNNHYYSFDSKKINKKNFFNLMKNNINYLIEIFWWNFMINTDNYYGFQEYENLEDFNISNDKLFIQDYQNFKYIILKFDEISNWDIILSDIFNKKIKIVKSNITEKKNKKVNSLYNDFKNNFKIPKNLFKLIMFKDFKMHSMHKVCNHFEIMKKFYNQEKIDDYFKKWELKSISLIPDSLYDDDKSSDEILKNIDDYFKSK